MNPYVMLEIRHSQSMSFFTFYNALNIGCFMIKYLVKKIGV